MPNITKQSQIDDRDHTIKVQEGLIEKLQLEAAKKIAWEEKPQDHVVKVNSATQTNRVCNNYISNEYVPFVMFAN